MDETFAKAISKAMLESVSKVADEIYDLAVVTAGKRNEIAKLKEEMAYLEAVNRIAVSTKTNENTGKPFFPNVDSQNAAVTVGLHDSDKYTVLKDRYTELLFELEKDKAKLDRLHEQRRDEKAEADYFAGILTP